MNDNLASIIHRMSPNDDLVNGNNNYALAQPGNAYLFYLSNGGNATVDLAASLNSDSFSVRWFNTRTGEIITRGNINGGSTNTNLGNPPNEINQDWAILLRRISQPNSETEDQLCLPIPAENGATSLVCL